MRHHVVRLLAAFVLFMLYSLSLLCLQTEAAEPIRINGSGSILDMLRPLVTAYTKTHPKVSFEIEKPLGGSGSVKALLVGALDIAAISKPLKYGEAAKGAFSHDYGKTPLLIITERSVRKSNITTKELEDIYSRKLQRWPNGDPIRLILRPEDDVDTMILRKFSPGMDRAISIANSHPGMIVAVTDPESNDFVAKTAGAIGAATLTSIVVETLQLNVLSLNGVKGTTKTLANGSYPLARDIRFITTAKTPVAARKFLDFVYSPQGRTIARKAGVLVAAGPKNVK